MADGVLIVGYTRRMVFCVLLSCLLLVWGTPVRALNPGLEINQYAHTVWHYHTGFVIQSIAQTPDGYLWFGTTSGLWRSDGARTVPWEFPPDQTLPNQRIRSLLAAPDGTLWIGTQSGLASMKGHKLTNLSQFFGATINGLALDRDGTLWVVGRRANLLSFACGMDEGGIHCFGADGTLDQSAYAIHEDSAGRLWVMAEKGLWLLNSSPPRLYATPSGDEAQSLANDTDGAMLVITDHLQKFRDGRFETIQLPANVEARSVFVDRDGAAWIGTSDRGLLHRYNGHTDSFSIPDGLSGDEIRNIFEDREGNVWVATDGGLDRFRALPAATYSNGKQLTTPGEASVLANPDGSVWIGTPDGLFRWQDGKMITYRPSRENASQKPGPEDVIVPGWPRRTYDSLLRDSRGRVWFGSYTGLGYFESGRFNSVPGLPPGYVDSMTEDPKGNIWVAHRAGLFRVPPGGSAQPVKPPLEEKLSIWRVAADPVQGGLWAGLSNGTLIHLIDNKVVASYGPDEGFSDGFINEVRVAPDGAIWIARQSGLSRIKNDQVATLDKRGGMPCDGAHASIEGDDNAFWIYSYCGLVRIPQSDIDTWTAAVDDRKPPPVVRTTVVSGDEGVFSYTTFGGSATPHLTKTPDGKLWMATLNGVTVVDPRHLAFNPVPPPVHIESVTADGNSFSVVQELRLPPLTHDLTFNFNALSLAEPEKIHFRYKLEGQDRDWREIIDQRSVQYSNLAPGAYRFRVIASNNSGIWNKQGASLALAVMPAFWQTNWFLAGCVLASLGLLLALYQWQIQRVATAAAKVKEVERRQHEARAELAHANRLATMGQLTASLAHEVNQPLGAVLTNAQAAMRWLSDPKLNIDEVKQNLNRIIRDVSRAAGIVKRVHVMAKKAPEQREEVAVNEAVSEIIAMMAGEAAKQRIVIKEQLSSGLPKVYADRVELQQVILNLLMNAMEAMTASNCEPKEITVETKLNKSGDLQVSIRDCGPGISREALGQVFQPFYTNKGSGLGLGLSICRAIIEAHDGRLWAEPNVPRGAVFSFTLPLAPARSRHP